MRELQLMANLSNEHLDVTGYTREHIADILETSPSELEKRYMSKFPVRAEKFRLRQRAQHVFEEALRVVKFRSLLKSRPSESLLTELGTLMNQTQESCRDLYECSCPELDELCKIARGHGAYGSRLTGAGWGGCTVHLVPKDKVDVIKEAWEKEYYLLKYPDISTEQLSEAVVVSQPGSGAMLYDFSCSYTDAPVQILTSLPGTKRALDKKKPSPRNRDGHTSDLSTIDLECAGLGPPPPPAVVRQHHNDHFRAEDEYETITVRRRVNEFWRYNVRGDTPQHLSVDDDGCRLWVENPSEDEVWTPESDDSGSIIPAPLPPPPTAATSLVALWLHRRSVDVATLPERWSEEIRPALGTLCRRLTPTTLSLRDGWSWWRDAVLRPLAEGGQGRWNVEIGVFVADCCGNCVDGVVVNSMGCCVACCDGDLTIG